jgi:catechol 2,3-dioxygenase-like lactoylglutathione lyase family enzyme
MNITPIIRCSNLDESVKFYTQVLDFQLLQPVSTEFPYRSLERAGATLDLSTSDGDGSFGSCVYIEVENLDALYKDFTARGLDVSNKSGVHTAPINQTWGMREFYVEDPDKNTLRFGQAVE